jgi:hypothetical protein
LWKAWFLPLLKGEHAPSVPKEPPVAHTVDRVENVPYTPAEIADRTRGYEEKMKVHEKTMKVHTSNMPTTHALEHTPLNNEQFAINSTSVVHDSLD